jgi:PAS domain S-box-containing protein
MKTKNHLLNETFLSNVLDMAYDAIIATDESYNIILFNKGAERIFGYESAEVLGKSFDILLPVADFENLGEHLHTIHKSTDTQFQMKVQGNFSGRHKNNSIFPAEASIAKSAADSKTILTIVLRDISERKLSEEALTQSEVRYRRLFETAKDGILILDAETGMIDDVNPFLVELLGYPYEKFVKKAIWEIGFFKDIADNYDKFLELQNKEYVRYDDLPLETATGRKINVEFVSNVYLVDNHKVIQCNIRDITKRKQAELELIISKEKAEESDRLKTAFLRNISHEIRTPLNGIIGFSGLLNTKNLSKEDINEFTTIIAQSGNRLIEIVNNVLDISKIQTGQVKIDNKPIIINTIFTDLLYFFLPFAKLRNNNLHFENIYDTFRTIYSDEAKLRQILTSLINNAIKFTCSGRIDFGYVLKEDFIEIYVKDEGIGIEPEFYDKIFHSFIQAEQTTARNYDGAGLGLAICKGLVELFGGKIWVESEINKGTTFFFTIPYTQVALPLNTDSKYSENYINPYQRKILIAEDDLISFGFLNRMLINYDIDVIHAEHGAQAVEIVRNTPDIDLILMDIRMPVMDGIEAARLIKQLRPDLPIIAQTAYAFREEKNKILSIGCDDYLSKPIEAFKMNDLIHKYLGLTIGS